MNNIRKYIYETLAGYNVFKHNTLEVTELQMYDTFATYSITKAGGTVFYDNGNNYEYFEGTINIYSREDLDLYQEIDKIKTLLSDAGFIIIDYGYSIPVDDLEIYDGLGLHYYIKMEVNDG